MPSGGKGMPDVFGGATETGVIVGRKTTFVGSGVLVGNITIPGAFVDIGEQPINNRNTTQEKNPAINFIQ
jgi:hypothetical protein